MVNIFCSNKHYFVILFFVSSIPCIITLLQFTETIPYGWTVALFFTFCCLKLYCDELTEISWDISLIISSGQITLKWKCWIKKELHFQSLGSYCHIALQKHFSGRPGGSVGWTSISWFRLGSWSHSSGDRAPCWALGWQCRPCLGFLLSLPLSLCPSLLSFSNKHYFKNYFKIKHFSNFLVSRSILLKIKDPKSFC